jgi:hypothetical protein
MECHSLRVPSFKLEMIRNCLILTKLGYITEALEYEKAV